MFMDDKQRLDAAMAWIKQVEAGDKMLLTIVQERNFKKRMEIFWFIEFPDLVNLEES